jgi:hypothetical protein
MTDFAPVTTTKPLSERKTGLLIATIAGLAGGPIGLVASPLVLYLLTRTLKAKNGKQPNRFIPWALIGIVGVPLCLLPFSGNPSNNQSQIPQQTISKERQIPSMGANHPANQNGDAQFAFSLVLGLVALGSSTFAFFCYSKSKRLAEFYGPIVDVEKEIMSRRMEAEEEAQKAQLLVGQKLQARLSKLTEDGRKEEIRLKEDISELEKNHLRLQEEKKNTMISHEKFIRTNKESQDQAKARLNALSLEISETNTKLLELRNQREAEDTLAIQAREALLAAQEAIEEEQELREIGFHPRRYPDLRSEELELKLIENRQSQKKEGSLALKRISVLSTLQLDGSVQKGRDLQKKTLKSYLRGFNGECDSLVNSVNHGNIDIIHKKLAKAFDFYKQQAANFHIPWGDDLLALRLEEADLVHENSIARQLEREEQARIREEMREEARALREMEEAEKAAQREADKLRQLLEKERREAELSKQDDVHKQRVAELERLLLEAEANKERAISRAQMTRSGHVYVISNIGSFGEGVFKVGMTRRLDPMDRVRELGDASVPFPFDVHAIIFTDDAPGLENSIHNEIQSYRLNRINTKREFFAISHGELKAAIDRAADTVNIQYRVLWTRYADAEQYRQSLREQGSRPSERIARPFGAPPPPPPPPSPLPQTP